MSDFEGRERPPTDRGAVFLLVGLGIVCTFLLHGVVGGGLWALGVASSAVLFAVSPDDPMYVVAQIGEVASLAW